jgi:hypothetical protein
LPGLVLIKRQAGPAVAFAQRLGGKRTQTEAQQFAYGEK